MTDSVYSFNIRFGGAATEAGVVPMPRVVLMHYAHLGVTDAEYTWISHILAYKWTGDDPFPRRVVLACRAKRKTQQRYAAHLRGLGLLFTSRRWRDGRLASLVYDFDSLLHNCVALHDAIAERAAEYVRCEDGLDCDDPNYRIALRRATYLVADGVAAQYQVTLPPQTMRRLEAGQYDYVPDPWAKLIHSPGNESADEPEPGCALDEFIPPRPRPPDPAQSDRPASIPVQAGGGDSVAEAVVDGLLRWNGVTGGIEAMPAKRRTAWVRQVAEVIDQWGGATVEQARLAWQAWMIRVGWPQPASPFAKTWPDSFGQQLSAARNGDVTIEMLRRESQQQQRGRKHPPSPPADPQAVQREQDEMLQRRHEVEKTARADEPPEFWRDTLAQLRLQMTRSVFEHALGGSSAYRQNGNVVILLRNAPSAAAAGRLSGKITSTLSRVLGDAVGVDALVMEVMDG